MPRISRRALPTQAVALARYLIGKHLVHATAAGRIAGRIVETEAYATGDPTGYARPGLTTRNASLFAERGAAYMRMVYGACLTLNLAADAAGAGAASAGHDPHRIVARSAPAAAFHRAWQPFRERSAIMRPMQRVAILICSFAAATAFAADRAPLTESDFRGTLGVADNVRLSYRGPDCKPVSFENFSEAMHAPGVNADIDRAADGASITLTAKRRGGDTCPAPYPPVRELPQFELRDLAGKRVSSESLKGKPTLINFYFAQCVPCILEVGPINNFAASRPGMNFLAVTFDEPEVARAFVARYKFRWRVVPDAREFIDRVHIKKYPTMALFDANGRLLGTRAGGVRDELEAANVERLLARWVDGLLRTSKPAPASTP